jgi:hypothetical protein
LTVAHDRQEPDGDWRFDACGLVGRDRLIAVNCGSSARAGHSSRKGFGGWRNARQFIHRNAASHRKDPIMTTRTHTAAALALSLLMTLAIFSGVSGLASPSHAGAQLAQAAQVEPAPRS